MYLPISPHDQEVSKVTFKRSLRGLNSEFSFSQIGYDTKVKKAQFVLLFISTGERKVMHPIVLSEIQTTSSKIWTQRAVTISYDDDNYTTNTWIDIGLYVNFIYYFKNLMVRFGFMA